MGDVGNFIFGGSSSKQKGQNQSQYQQASLNQAQNSSAQASTSASNNYQTAGSTGFNQAYGPISAAMMPALGYTSQAGSMMASLLGLPGNTFSYNQTPYNPPASVMPAQPTGSTIELPALSALLGDVKQTLPTPQPTIPIPTDLPPPTSSPSTGVTRRRPPGVSASYDRYIASKGGGGGTGSLVNFANIASRETGGPVTAGRPYIVGERQPELFVPSQNGTILPSVPNQTSDRLSPGFGLASGDVGPSNIEATGLNNWANSGGINFILDQGQKAISGASAGNGVFNSGATGKALVNYGQQLGNTFLNNYMGHLTNLGQLGLGAASGLSNAGGVNISQSQGGGSSLSNSAGLSQGSSTGVSSGAGTSSGTTSGGSSGKKGVIPSILGT